jgi:penicillin-binding protein 2
MNVSDRKFVIILIFLTVGVLFLLRLFYLQVVDDQWKIKGANASERIITEYPSRGLIFDRTGKIVVANTAVYDLMVIPKDVKNIDTLSFCVLLGIDTTEYRIRINAARAYSRYKPTVFEKQIPASDYVRIAENIHRYPGFYGQPRTLRYYPGSVASHSVGYVSEATPKTIESNPYYKPGDYIGVNGVESIYEEALRGRRGKRFVLVDVHNNIRGSFADGKFDTLAEAGKNLTSTIDLELQKYGEILMQGKRGSIVAIEPSTGEILCMVTNPGYDPNLLVGRVRGPNYTALNADTLKPLFNRSLMAQYPPGSTFKLLQALIGLQEGVIDEHTQFSCHGGYLFGGRIRPKCHPHSSPVDLSYSISTSCNSYYSNVFKRILNKYPTTSEGYDVWRNYITRFGLGSRLNVDLTAEVKGSVPQSAYYDKVYGKNRWNGQTILSLAIGQGELGVTPVQMANFVTVIANRGWYYTPHYIREIDGEPISDTTYTTKRITGIDAVHFEKVVDGMYRVVEGGTGRGVRFSPDIEVCGKTGTAENPHGKDHSIFIAFAPKENPKIAMAVYVENVGFGSTWAAPIASLMMEQYLTDTISRPLIEERMINANLIKPAL